MWSLVSCIYTNFNSLIYTFKRINIMWMSNFNLFSRSSHRISLNWNELEISFWFNESFRLKQCWAVINFSLLPYLSSGSGEVSIFTLPRKSSFWHFPLNPPTHLWKRQTLNTQCLWKIQNLQPSQMHKKCSASWFQKILHTSTEKKTKHNFTAKRND